MEATEEQKAAARERLHSKPCPWCLLEPEVRFYYRDKVTKLPRGYVCTCGARVVDGFIEGLNID